MTTYQLYRLILKLYTIILLLTYIIGTLDLLLLLDKELHSTHSTFQARGRGVRGGGPGRGQTVASEWRANNPGWGAPESVRSAEPSCSQRSKARSARPFSFTQRSPSRSPSPPGVRRRVRIESDDEEGHQHDKEGEKDKEGEEGSHQDQDERCDDDEECSVVRVVRPKPDLVPLVGPRPSETLDPALRAMGRRPISEFKKPRPIKRDPEKADKNILPDTTTAPKVSRGVTKSDGDPEALLEP